LKVIWAPWRIKYILQEKPKGCIFCEYRDHPEKDEDNLVVYRGKKVLAVLNLYPYNPGHLMIAPYRHIGDITELDDDELLELNKTLQLVIKAISNAMKPDGYNIGINLGKVAGAGIEDHIHIHVVPRWLGDTNFMPVIANAKVIPEALKDTYRKIRKAIVEITHG